MGCDDGPTDLDVAVGLGGVIDMTRSIPFELLRVGLPNEFK